MDRMLWSSSIQRFLLPFRDFTDALLHHLRNDPNLSWEHIIFELEDFLGGHSAIGNLTMLVLAAVLKHPHVGDQIRKEVITLSISYKIYPIYDHYIIAILLQAQWYVIIFA